MLHDQLDPCWLEHDARHTLQVMFTPTATLNVAVWDYDELGSNDFMCSCEVPLADLANRQVTKQQRIPLWFCVFVFAFMRFDHLDSKQALTTSQVSSEPIRSIHSRSKN